MQALILSAGFGTRLYPLTRENPKALLKINKKPAIEHIIKKIKRIKEIKTVSIMSNNKFYINFLEWLEEYKYKENRIKIKILNNSVNYEQNKKGAVEDFKLALKFIEEDDLLLIASDNLFEFDLNDLINFSREKNASTIILRRTKYPEVIKKSNNTILDENNKIIFFEEKPKVAKSDIFGTACYFLKKKDIKKIIAHNFQNSENFGDIISFLHQESDVYGRIFEGFWIDIGCKEDLEKAENYFKNHILNQ